MPDDLTPSRAKSADNSAAKGHLEMRPFGLCLEYEFKMRLQSTPD